MNAIELKEKRLKLGISQKLLAQLVGVSTQTINGYENGKKIPVTKYQILEQTLNNKSNIEYQQKYKIDPILIQDILIEAKPRVIPQKACDLKEEINERKKLVRSLKHFKRPIEHQEKMIKILEDHLEVLMNNSEDPGS